MMHISHLWSMLLLQQRPRGPHQLLGPLAQRHVDGGRASARTVSQLGRILNAEEIYLEESVCQVQGCVHD